ncbi:MAG: adenylate/guanylate cyclase domain-containing protein [Cyanobacteria bacterium P01_A01_bin.105]
MLSALHSSPTETYSQWRHRFMARRLQLGIRFGLFYLLSFLPIDIGQYLTGNQNPFDLYWILLNLLRLGILTGCWGLLNRQFDFTQRWTTTYLAGVFLLTSGSVGLLHRLFDTAKALLQGTGQVSPDLFGWALLFITQSTLIPVRWPLHLASQLLIVAYYFGVNSLLGLRIATTETSLADISLNIFWICCICNCSVYFYERLSAANFHANRQLREAKDRSEQLLLNILPKSVADKLKLGPGTIAEDFTEVTVLFADLVDFTRLADGTTAAEVVDLLNQVFSTFDQLAERHGIEKIKTIGDAYMVVAGLPEPRADHASAIALMAVEMRAALTSFSQSLNRPLAIRIGIHTGPVVAGVIGLKKFAYDLWGDTVNTASRMESYGLPGEIQVSPTTYQWLKQQYQFQPRGPLEVKGKGRMMTYLLREALPASKAIPLKSKMAGDREEK